ncbi:hypothetical protein ACFLS4_03525 [Bacteroidota bacterium]
MKKVIFVAFSFISVFSYSQVENATVKEDGSISGYIITKQNEQKPGYIFISNNEANSEYVDYLKFRNAPKERLTKNDISGYGYDNIVYELKPCRNDSVFMQRINNVEPFVYYYKGKDIKEIYIENGENFSLLPSDKSELVEELKRLFNDCNEVLDQMEYASYNKKRVSNILVYYNECSNKKLPYFKIGVITGYMFNNISFNNSSFKSYYESGPMVSVIKPSFEQRSGYNIGIFFDVPFLENKFNWTFHTEIEFSKVKYDFTGQANLVNDWDYPDLVNKDLDFEMKYYNANIFFRYNSLRKKASLYTDFGPVLSICKDIMKLGNTDVDFNLNQFMIGMGAGIGIDYPIFNKYTLNAGLKANYLFSAGGEEYEKFRVWNWGFALGIGI